MFKVIAFIFIVTMSTQCKTVDQSGLNSDDNQDKIEAKARSTIEAEIKALEAQVKTLEAQLPADSKDADGNLKPLFRDTPISDVERNFRSKHKELHDLKGMLSRLGSTMNCVNRSDAAVQEFNVTFLRIVRKSISTSLPGAPGEYTLKYEGVAKPFVAPMATVRYLRRGTSSMQEANLSHFQLKALAGEDTGDIHLRFKDYRLTGNLKSITGQAKAGGISKAVLTLRAANGKEFPMTCALPSWIQAHFE